MVMTPAALLAGFAPGTGTSLDEERRGEFLFSFISVASCMAPILDCIFFLNYLYLHSNSKLPNHAPVRFYSLTACLIPSLHFSTSQIW
jgi:hypothetical protein